MHFIVPYGFLKILKKRRFESYFLKLPVKLICVKYDYIKKNEKKP